MPRKSKGPRLYWRKPTATRKGVYVVRDGATEFSTCTTDRLTAETALRTYLNEKDRPTVRPLSEVLVSEVLATYGEKHAYKAACPERIGYAIDALNLWWAGRSVSDVSVDSCEQYIQDMRAGYHAPASEKPRRPVQDGTIRRELGCLRSALICCKKRGLLETVPPMAFPDKPPAKERWLTRSEAARLIRAARKADRTRYMARFILVGLYTGSRKAVILGLKFAPHPMGGHVDLATQKLYRKARTQRATRKEAPTVTLPRRLLRHLERWQRNGSRWVVENGGLGIADMKNDWEAVRDAAGLPDVTPHTLRHTAITWAMRSGANVWHISGYFGVSLDTLEKVYAHHHPDHMLSAVSAANLMGK